MADRNIRILVADDRLDIRDTLSDILTDKGYDSTTAADGREAVDIFREKGRLLFFRGQFNKVYTLPEPQRRRALK